MREFTRICYCIWPRDAENGSGFSSSKSVAYWIISFFTCRSLCSFVLNNIGSCSHARTISHKLRIWPIASYPWLNFSFRFFPASSGSHPQAINCFCAFSPIIYKLCSKVKYLRLTVTGYCTFSIVFVGAPFVHSVCPFYFANMPSLTHFGAVK